MVGVTEKDRGERQCTPQESFDVCLPGQTDVTISILWTCNTRRCLMMIK